jgi:anti-sigma factor ChrR (cupin superfamily)
MQETIMNINADLSQPAVVNSELLPWIDSPLPGVQRRMLERDGAEVARATTLVRFQPGSFFEEHTHDAGEEFLVLEGVFSDEMGDFPAGMYVRNPIGSRHRPHTREGTTILVKLRQFDPADQEYVRVDTANARWLTNPETGISHLPLHEFGDERIAMLRLAPGSRYRHTYVGGEEIFVVSGSFTDQHRDYVTGSWIRNPGDSTHSLFSEHGALLFVKTGHLSC